MRTWIVRSLFFWGALGVFAEPLTLVNTLPTRPVFNLKSEGTVLTRTVAPGQKVHLEPGLFSGLGDKEVRLEAGSIYYMARFGPTPGLYRLPADQCLILNHAGAAVRFGLEGSSSVQGLMAAGTLALGSMDAENSLTAVWDDGTGQTRQLGLIGGRIYRLVLDSPEGLGTAVSLMPWD